MALRVIPRLDIKGPNLVKGIHLEGLRVLGKPEVFAKYYYEQGADELIYMDAVASLYGRNNLVEIVEKTARQIFIPLTVGGGIRSIDDIQKVLRAGADKVSINTAAIQNPSFIKEAVKRFGSSTIVISIEAIRKEDGTYEAYTDCGRQSSGLDVYDWVNRVVDYGAGELMITSIDREGTGKGFDIELTSRISKTVPVPVIASGGAGKLSHLMDVAHDGHADAVAIASILHYNCINKLRSSDADFKTEGNIEFLKSGTKFSHFEDIGIREIKEAYRSRKVECRL